jgi:hypothetical protein
MYRMLVGKRRALGYALRGTQQTTKAPLATTSMEILCPNCQRKLTIPEQYAGQQMKCPLCQGTFTAPALAPAAPNLAPAPPPSPAPPPPAPGPVAAPPPPPGPAAPGVAPPPSTPAPPTTPLEYSGKFSILVNPRYLQFVPLAALLIIFILTFFPWVGVYVGGVGVDTQSAWQAAFASVSTDSDLEEYSAVKSKVANVEVGVSVLTIFYLLGFLATLFVVIAAVGLEFGGKYLPPNLEKFTRWRWVAVAVVALGSFFMLLLQHALPFNFEARVSDKADAEAKKMEESPAFQALNPTQKRKRLEVFRGIMANAVKRTVWYQWTFWLHFWALVFAVVLMLGNLRYPRPSPRIDVWW